MRRSASRALIFQEQDDIARIVRSVGQDLEQARWIHAQIEQSQHRRNRFLANLLVEMYGKCGRIREARAVFDGMVEQPNDFSWNILAWAYATNGQLAAAEEIFHSMTLRSSVSWTSMIQIYSHYSNPFLAQEVLGRMPEWNLISWNTLIAAYAQSGHLQESTEVFLAMPKRDVISWCSLLAGFALAGDPSSAQRFFQQSPHHDRVSATSVLQVLGGDQGRVIFDRMEERDKISWNAMIAANWSSLEGARAVFDRIPLRDLVAWTAMIQASARLGLFVAAKEFFDAMPGRDLMAWTTIVAGSSEFAAAQIAFSKMPQWSVVSLTALLDHHDDHRSTGNLSLDLFDLFDRMPERNVVSWTAMLGSLARRMDLLAAKRVFDRMPQHTIVSWNAIMAAFALSSSAMTAIVSFQRLILDGLPVNSITFLVLLTACSHLGLVDQSRDYLVAMAMDFGVPPSVDHYSCMVDVLGRSGQLQFATSLLATMPMVPDYVAWCSVVSASKNLHDVESGVFAARSGLELRARDPGLNLLLSNIYFGGLQRISPDLS